MLMSVVILAQYTVYNKCDNAFHTILILTDYSFLLTNV